jgi:hypothetical protein
MPMNWMDTSTALQDLAYFVECHEVLANPRQLVQFSGRSCNKHVSAQWIRRQHVAP